MSHNPGVTKIDWPSTSFSIFSIFRYIRALCGTHYFSHHNAIAFLSKILDRDKEYVNSMLLKLEVELITIGHSMAVGVATMSHYLDQKRTSVGCHKHKTFVGGLLVPLTMMRAARRILSKSHKERVALHSLGFQRVASGRYLHVPKWQTPQYSHHL